MRDRLDHADADAEPGTAGAYRRWCAGARTSRRSSMRIHRQARCVNRAVSIAGAARGLAHLQAVAASPQPSGQTHDA